MKHKFILFAIIATSLCACGGQNTPTPPNGNGGGGNGNTQSVSIDFTYQVTAPFTYSFTNTSKGADSYKWDFGDGDWSNEKNVTHRYASAGTYTVTLTGTAGGQKYDARKKLTVQKPSIYVAGYTLHKIPFENKYYKVVCKDDDWFGTAWSFTTVYTPLLDNTDIPYTARWSSPKLMDKLDGDDYYTIYVYHTTNTSSTSGDTQCLKQKLTKSTIYQYQNEYILTSDNGQTKIGILMEYK